MIKLKYKLSHIHEILLVKLVKVHRVSIKLFFILSFMAWAFFESIGMPPKRRESQALDEAHASEGQTHLDVTTSKNAKRRAEQLMMDDLFSRFQHEKWEHDTINRKSRIVGSVIEHTTPTKRFKLTSEDIRVRIYPHKLKLTGDLTYDNERMCAYPRVEYFVWLDNHDNQIRSGALDTGQTIEIGPLNTPGHEMVFPTDKDTGQRIRFDAKESINLWNNTLVGPIDYEKVELFPESLEPGDNLNSLSGQGTGYRGVSIKSKTQYKIPQLVSEDSPNGKSYDKFQINFVRPPMMVEKMTSAIYKLKHVRFSFFIRERDRSDYREITKDNLMSFSLDAIIQRGRVQQIVDVFSNSDNPIARAVAIKRLYALNKQCLSHPLNPRKKFDVQISNKEDISRYVLNPEEIIFYLGQKHEWFGPNI